MARFTSKIQQKSGMALGGIGTGSVELWPDGEFHFWQISNQSRWSGTQGGFFADDGNQHTGALSFWVRTSQNGGTTVRRLGQGARQGDFSYRMFPRFKPIDTIEYDARFPVCELDYRDPALPVSAKLKALAPFVPHDDDISSTPGFILDFSVENTSDGDAEISLLGALEPSFMNKKRCKNTLWQKDGVTAVSLYPERIDSDPDTGDLTFSVAGDGDASYITADIFRYLREFIAYSPCGVTQESFLFDFYDTGRLPDTGEGNAPVIPDDVLALSDEKLDDLAEALSRYAFARSYLDRMRRFDPSYPASRTQKEEFINHISGIIRYQGGEFGSTALCKTFTLKKGEKAEARFVLAWYFENHYSQSGEVMGHYYENMYQNSLDAALTLQNTDISQRAKAFSALLYNTDAEKYFPDCWSSHLSTLIKDSWRLKNNKFGLWEGLGSCGFHTTDITYHASLPLLSLFPRLQLGQMRMGAAFQREDGRVHHFFTPDLEHVDDGYDRVDMCPQFALLVCRDFLYTGDREYLRDMYPHVVAAMDSIAVLDKNNDALPDTDTKRNTYDAWNFSGTPVYISILWLAALKAAARLADEVNDLKNAEKWRKTLKTGKISLEKLLFNGDYYDLWRDGDEYDAALMTDQLDGEWFLRVASIGGNLPNERVRAIVKYIFDHNFERDRGLINATCPKDRPVSPATYKNCQAEAVWTGIGYVFAALAASVGLYDVCLSAVKSIDENQSRFGLYFDHWECGGYYTRPMAAFSTLTALTGMSLDCVNRTLSFSPVKSGRYPLITPQFIGTVTFSDGDCVIDAVSGSLDGFAVTVNADTV